MIVSAREMIVGARSWSWVLVHDRGCSFMIVSASLCSWVIVQPCKYSCMILSVRAWVWALVHNRKCSYMFVSAVHDREFSCSARQWGLVGDRECSCMIVSTPALSWVLVYDREFSFEVASARVCSLTKIEINSVKSRIHGLPTWTFSCFQHLNYPRFFCTHKIKTLRLNRWQNYPWIWEPIRSSSHYIPLQKFGTNSC